MLRKTALALCVALIAGILPLSVSANGQIMVSVRVESIDHTMFFDPGALLDEGITVLQALAALDVGMTNGTQHRGWEFAINNEPISANFDETYLQDGDELVIFLHSWEEAAYAFFTPSIVEVLTGEELELQLEAINAEGQRHIVAGALLEIISDAPTDRMFRYTDENGRIDLFFRLPGRYYVSATLKDEEGQNKISRPMSLWLVGEQEHPHEFQPGLVPNAATIPTYPFGNPDTLATAEENRPIEHGFQPGPDPMAPTIPAYPFGSPHTQVIPEEDRFIEIQSGLWVEPYGGTIWRDADYIIPRQRPFTNEDGSIMVPFREVVEDLLNGQVTWDPTTNQTTATVGNQTTTFPLNTTAFTIILINNRIFTPVETIEYLFLTD